MFGTGSSYLTIFTPCLNAVKTPDTPWAVISCLSREWH